MARHQKPLELKNTRITDSLFGHYVDTVSEIMVPYQWKILTDENPDTEPTYCVQNFRIAAGREKGTRKGVVFQDTDLYKWIETVAYCLASGRAKEYEAVVDDVVELLSEAQEPDGYINTWFQVNQPDDKWQNLIEGHELYTSGHMFEAAAAYYHATGKDKFLNVARKNADLICRTFGNGEGQIPGYPGHEEVEIGLMKLYRITKDQRYLDQVRYFLEERGKKPNFFEAEMKRRKKPTFFPEFMNYDLEYSQAAVPPAEQTTAMGHAVRDMYLCTAMSDYAEETGDEKFLKACRAIWDNMVNRQMYITGGIGASGFRERFTTDYDLPNNTNYCETCASVGMMMFGRKMASIEGNAEYYDTVERALYNTLLGSVNLEGNRYFYVNPLEMVPEFCTSHTYMDHVKPIRQKWFNVACCPPNLARTIASLGKYIYAADEKALYIHQFISSETGGDAGDTSYSIKMDSDLLHSGKVKIKASLSADGMIKIRVSYYAEKYSVKLNGKDISVTEKDRYMELGLPSGESDIEIAFEIHPRWVSARDEVRADAGKVALMYGPFVYCLEEIDNGKNMAGIYVDPKEPIREVSKIKRFIGNLPIFGFDGVRLVNKGVENGKLYGLPKFEAEHVELKAVPYCMWNNRGIGEMTVWLRSRIPV